METVAELVDNLFRTYRRPDGREYTYKEVSVALGGTVEASHLSKLRTGKITNPGRETLLALCRFFQVPAAYFFPELLFLTQEEKENKVQVVLRSTRLDPKVKQKLEELIQALQGNEVVNKPDEEK